MAVIKQGDSYYLPVDITLDNDALDLSLVECVEFCLDNIRKTYPDKVSYDADTETFRLPLTQRETFALKTGRAAVLDVRIKFRNGDVIGLPKPLSVDVARAISGEVL